jgi:hypothetical protein
MIIKIKVGTQIKVNGKTYRVQEERLDNLDINGVSQSPAIVAYDDLDRIEIEFVDGMSLAISERDLGGLFSILAVG